MTPTRIRIRRRRRRLAPAEWARVRAVVRNLREYFTLEEVEGLAFELGIMPDDLSGETLTGKATALTRAALNRSQFGELERLIKRDRPNL